jgi:large subunit ribosomal protein L30
MTRASKAPRATLRITQVRSRIGNQRRIVKVLTDGLGLGRIGASVVLPDTPYTRGMVAKVSHMVNVEEIAAATPPSRRRKSAQASEVAAAAETAADTAETAAAEAAADES